jgi:hypothetical protein
MQLKKSVFMISAAVALYFPSISKSQDQFTDPGSIWLGGSFGFVSVGYEGADSRETVLMANPTARFFAGKNFFVGPALQWTGVFTDYSKRNLFGIGVDIGGAFNINQKVIPYIRSGIQFNIYSYSYDEDYYGEGLSYTANGFTIPIGIGLIIPLGKVLAIQVEPSYSIIRIDEQNENIFSISFGFAGIGGKKCISTLQSISDYF